MADAEAIRAFFALELGDGARRRAVALADAVRAAVGEEDLRWVREESLHVTLRFLGQTDVARLGDLVREVGAATRGVERFALRLGAVGAFPSPRRPRVVAVGLEPVAPLAALAAALERGVVAAGLPADPRPFRPHLTLARVRRGRRPRLPEPESLDAVTASVTAPGEAWEVVETVLFRSDLTPGGARYSPLERIPIGAGGPPGSSAPAFTPETRTRSHASRKRKET